MSMSFAVHRATPIEAQRMLLQAQVRGGEALVALVQRGRTAMGVLHVHLLQVAAGRRRRRRRLLVVLVVVLGEQPARDHALLYHLQFDPERSAKQQEKDSIWSVLFVMERIILVMHACMHGGAAINQSMS